MKQILLTICAFSLLLMCTYTLKAQELVINEVMASNGNTLADEDGDYEDWIELYNAGDEVVNLEGWGLSDDYGQPFRWLLPAVELRPGEHLVIWASNKDRNDPDGELHTNFAISSSGEEVILTRPDGERIDEVEPRAIPRDLSWGRFPDGTDNWFYFESATPGHPNANPSFSGIVEPPTFSHQPGFYTEPFLLEISHPDTNVTIYYTTDGSNPTTESQQYTGPIEIYDRSGEENVYSMIRTNVYSSGHSRGWNPPAGLVNKGTPLRIKVVRDGEMAYHNSESFFVFDEGHEIYSLPVFSIVTDPDNLFDDSIGIYVPGINYDGVNDGTGNYRMRGREWERVADITLFDEGEIAFSQTVGLRIHGGYTRRFPQKSLRIYARNDYGNRAIEYDVFRTGEFDEYKRLILRGSGNDWNFSMFRDGTIQDIWRHVGMEGQEFRPALAFINGEFWGIHNIRERLDKHYMFRRFGIEEEDLDILTRNQVVKEGDDDHYQMMIDFLSGANMELNESLTAVSEMMDIENFMDYYTLQVYCGNTDWPHNNIDYWRKRVDYDPDAPYGHDGRWRWLVYDLDRCLGYSSVQTNMINWIHSPNGNGRGEWATFVYRKLQENELFRHQFINRMADHLNTTFLSTRVRDYIDHNRELILDVIEEHIHRWRRPHNLTNWNGQVNSMRNFANQRPNIMRGHIRSRFQISRDISLSLDVNHSSKGIIHLNSLTIDADLPGVNPAAPYPWSGVYFHNIPVELSAEARAGYVFEYWTMEGDTLYEQSLSRAFQEDVEIVAHFSIDTTYEYFPEPWVASNCAYVFDYWPEDAEGGTYPEHMAFVYMEEEDPGPDATIAGFADGVYHLDSRTRINGLGEDGFSFINTGNSDGNPGYPGTQLGGAILALSTLEEEQLFIRWEGGTVTPNSRVYHLRLQYRIGEDGPFLDLMDGNGNPVEYQRNEEEGHSEVIGPIALPADVMGQPYVQLLWRYYHTGEQMDEDSGARDQLRVGHVLVSTDSSALSIYATSDFAAEIEISSGAACFDSAAPVPINVEVLSGIPELAWVMDGDTFFVAEDVQLYFPPGKYEYELIDGLGCTSMGFFEIPYSEAIEIEWEYEIPTCTGDEDGSITARITGGAAPIFYEWSTGMISSQPDRFVLWDFNNKVPADSPETSSGDGEAILIGGVNNPITGTNGSGSSDPASDNQAWQTTGYPSQGMAPRTAGVQFNFSTEGYRDIVFSFDQRLSNTAANTWVLLYTVDRTADSIVWEEAEIFRVEPQLSGTGDVWYNERQHDFSSVEGLNDNPHVAFRIVSDFDPETGQYESARLDRNYSGGGTARFDMVWAFGNPINRKTTLSDIPAGQYSIAILDGLGCVFADTLELPEPDPLPVPVISGMVQVDGGQLVFYEFVPENIGDFDLEVVVEKGEIDFLSPLELGVVWDEVPAGEMIEGLISIVLTDSLGCSAEYELRVFIFGPSSTENLRNEIKVEVYPNPNRGEFTVEVDYPDFGQDWTLELYSPIGQLLNRFKADMDLINIALEPSKTGAFVLVLRDGMGVVRYRDVILVF